MPTKKNQKLKREFSKVLWVAAMIHAAIISLFTMIAVIYTSDASPLEYLIPAVFAELAAATGFYFNKAKAENLIKLRKEYGSDIYNESGASGV